MEKLEILLTEKQLQAKVVELAAQINRDYEGKELLVVGILRGAFIFLADLVRELKIPVRVDFVAVSSYGDATESSGVVRILKDLDESIEGRHVLIVEDIIDTGLTLNYLYKNLKARHPASIRLCTLLDKPEKRQVEITPDYCGFSIPDHFVVGYGLDCGQLYRNLRDLYVIYPGQGSAHNTDQECEPIISVKGDQGMSERDLILVVDCDGGRYTQVAARRIRDAGVYCEIVHYTASWDEISAKHPCGIVLVGEQQCDPALLQGTVPVLEINRMQLQPELLDTPKGQGTLKNFLYTTCSCKGDWTPASFITTQIEEIKKTVGSSRVVGALSGGVDSTVAAALVHRAIGDRLTCIFVDHGLLRKGEREEVEKTLREQLGVQIITVDARERFLDKLSGVVDPEQKRKIIGHEFIRVFEEEASRLGELGFLLQGTLYPDVIESGPPGSAVIKSHHNVGGLPEDIKLRLLEPLRWLFKDEVRRVGLELGIPEELIWRQPFPGPGLAVRVLGEVTEEKLAMVREADYILRQEIKEAALDQTIWQYFAVLLPVRSVGMKDGARTYAHPIVIRAVISEDAMTADWARLPYDLLDKIADRIVNEVPGINRVLYDLTPKPPGTIEWE